MYVREFGEIRNTASNANAIKIMPGAASFISAALEIINVFIQKVVAGRRHSVTF